MEWSLPGNHSKHVSGKSSVGIRHNGSEDSDDNDEQDEPSSITPSDELSSFREKWQQELKSSPQHLRLQEPKNSPQHVRQLASSTRDENSETTECAHETIEEKAQALFMKGVQYEQEGKLYEAVKFYRRAVQLVPDIETRLYEASKAKVQPVEVDFEALSLEEASQEVSVTEEEEEDILLRFQRAFLRDRTVCQPDLPQNSTHLSSLPMEIILYIMKWIVSTELDLRALDVSCSAVCKGFYLAARDPEIWRLACIRVWGVNCGGLSNFESWRQMFIERPRVHFHGCYISKTTYIRHGENSFQDQFYRPWHLVEYFRYLRFFPEGLVLMLTTSDDPAVSVRELKHRNPRNSTVLRGHYRLHDDRVTIFLKREPDKVTGNNKTRNRKGRDSLWTEPCEQTFHLELQTASYRSHRHVQLVWQGYSVITLRGGNESTTNFDLISGRFPPFHFSRVKSYTSESESILQ